MSDSTILDFTLIPFRVVIFDILPFHEIRVGESHSEFELFGYFRNDSQRKIFFLFRTILIDRQFFKKNYHQVELPTKISLPKINQVVVRVSTFKQYIEKIEGLKLIRMRSLNSFTMISSCYECRKYEIGIKDLLIPHLRKISIEVDFNLDARKWNEFDFSRVESLKLKCKILLPEENCVLKLENLKNFELSNCSFIKTPVFHLPSLLSIRLVKVKNVSIKHGGKITKLKLIQCEESLFQKLIIESPRIMDLNYQPKDFRKPVPVKYLFLGPFQKCFNVCLSHVIFPSNNNHHQNFERFRKIQLQNCKLGSDFINSIFFQKEEEEKTNKKKCSNLISLSLSRITIHDSGGGDDKNSVFFFQNTLSSQKYYPIVSQLLRLEFSNCEFISDLLFQKIEFSNLRDLEIMGCSQIRGKNWNKFPNLKRLEVKEMNNLEEDQLFFFDTTEQQRFPFLERLVVERCEKVKGQNWGVFSKVKCLRIYWCNNFGDFLFHQNKFPSIETLYIRMCHSVFGINWNSEFMNNLVELRLAKCGQFKGTVFHSTEDAFSNLELLSFYRMHDLDVEKEWIGIRNLLELSCDACNISDIQFQGESMKSLISVDFSECYSVKGENWSFLPVLENFNYSYGPLNFKGEKPYGETTTEMIDKNY